LGKLLDFGANTLSSDIQLQILNQSENLHKHDKILDLRYHNESGEFVVTIEVIFNKFHPIKYLKTQLRATLGVPEERQILSEWYDNHYHQVFMNDNETLNYYKIRKGDVLRLDALRDKSQNINIPGEQKLILQLILFMCWNLTPQGHKEMCGTVPRLIIVNHNITLTELRIVIADQLNIAEEGMIIYKGTHFPIMEGETVVIDENYNPPPQRIYYAGRSLLSFSDDDISDWDNIIAASELEQQTSANTIKKFRLKTLDIIIARPVVQAKPKELTEQIITHHKETKLVIH